MQENHPLAEFILNACLPIARFWQNCTIISSKNFTTNLQKICCRMRIKNNINLCFFYEKKYVFIIGKKDILLQIAHKRLILLSNLFRPN